MSRFVPPIRRRKAGRGHYYLDGNDRRIPGVTTIINDGLPKPALVKWAGRTVAETAINRWDELGGMPVAARLKVLTDAPWADRDAAANRGTEIHALAERLVGGEQVEIPEALGGHVDAYVKFLDEFEPTPVLVESVVMSYRHGYCGTTDGVFDFPDFGRLLVDIKSGRSGVFGDVAVQLAGYRYADVWVEVSGEEHPMPEVDGCAVIHVRADGASLVPVQAGPIEHRTLLYIMQVAEFANHSRDLVGDEIVPPSRGRHLGAAS